MRLVFLGTATSVLPLAAFGSILGPVALFLRLLSKPVVFRFEFFLILYLVFFLVSAAFYDAGAFLRYGFYRYDANFIIIALTYFSFAMLIPSLNARATLGILICVAFAYSVSLLFWKVGAVDAFGGAGSFNGFHSARNAAGGFLSIVCFSLLIFYSQNRSKFICFSVIAVFLCLLATYSRGSIMGFLLAAIVYILFRRKRLLLDLSMLFSLVILTMAIASYFHKPSIDYSDQGVVVESFLESDSGAKAANVITRAVYLWPKAIEMFRENPVVGQGVGSYNEYGGYRAKIFGDRPDTFVYDNPSNAHNSFLQVLSETGMIGVVIYLLFFLYFRQFWLRNRVADPLFADLAYFSLLVVAFASFTEHRLSTPSSMILVSALMGNFAARIRTQRAKAVRDELGLSALE